MRSRLRAADRARADPHFRPDRGERFRWLPERHGPAQPGSGRVMSTADKVLVTGMGTVAPNGLGVEEFWRSTLQGHNAIGDLEGFDVSRYPCRLAGQIRDFDA